MIKNRYISTLLNFTDSQIIIGLKEIKKKYKKNIKFKVKKLIAKIKTIINEKLKEK